MTSHRSPLQLCREAVHARSVAEAVAACAGAVRENIRLRRACRLDAQAGVVASYLHASPAPGLGRMGALVRLESASGRLEGAAADVAQVGPAPWVRIKELGLPIPPG